MKRILTTVAGVAMALALAVPAAAQVTVGGEGGLMVTLYNPGSSGEKQTGMGFFGAVDVGLKDTGKAAISVIGQIVRNSFAESGGDPGYSTMSFAAGGRVAFPVGTGRLSAFAQFLIGRLTCCDDYSATTIEPGGGVKIRINEMLGAIAGVGITRLKDEDGWYGETRLFFGVTIGKK